MNNELILQPVMAMMLLITKLGKITILKLLYAMRSARSSPNRFTRRFLISAHSAAPSFPQAATGLAIGRPQGAPYSITA